MTAGSAPSAGAATDATASGSPSGAPLPLVLLPGMMCDARLFAPQVAAFSAERAVQVGCLAGARDMHALARRVLDAAPVEFALAGLSMGGIVAMEICRIAPARVRALALLDTNPLPEPEDVARVRAGQVERVVAGGLVEVMRDELKPNYLADGPRRQDVLALCMAMAESLGPETFVDQARAITTRPDQRKTLRAVAVPTLVLTGESDTLCPRERHELMHALVAGSTLEIVPGAGHLPTLERPALTTEKLREWLART